MKVSGIKSSRTPDFAIAQVRGIRLMLMDFIISQPHLLHTERLICFQDPIMSYILPFSETLLVLLENLKVSVFLGAQCLKSVSN